MPGKPQNLNQALKNQKVMANIHFSDQSDKPLNSSLSGIIDKHFEDLNLILEVSFMLIGNTDAVSLRIKKLIADDTTTTKWILSTLQQYSVTNFADVVKLVGPGTAGKVRDYV